MVVVAASEADEEEGAEEDGEVTNRVCALLSWLRSFLYRSLGLPCLVYLPIPVL